MELEAIQRALREARLDGWLFYDHHHRDPIAYRVLGLPAGLLATRRWYYLIPAVGKPRKLAHRIEAGALDVLPGERRLYARWTELEAGLRALTAGVKTVAMQYSPQCGLPAIAMADAGTVEQVRGLGCEVVSSGSLIAALDACWTPAMLASHRAAGRVVDATIAAAFGYVRERLQAGLTEYELQRWMVKRMEAAGLVVEEAPIVAVNAHSGDPHYEPRAEGSAAIRAGDVLLLDVWAKTADAGAAYYDVTWMGYCLRAGEAEAPEGVRRTFACAKAAREAALAFVVEGVKAGRAIHGFEVDRAAREVIEAAGLGDYFVHRTGHSLGVEVHASGANMDDYETHDERLILPNTAFSVEPGIYLPHGAPFGVRTEINVHVGAGIAEATGPRQAEIVRI